jgi:CarD family transcriptional regulator
VTFQVGDKVIYPNHGLGIVERVEEKTILGQTLGFFHLRIVSNDTTVLMIWICSRRCAWLPC